MAQSDKNIETAFKGLYIAAVGLAGTDSLSHSAKSTEGLMTLAFNGASVLSFGLFVVGSAAITKALVNLISDRYEPKL